MGWWLAGVSFGSLESHQESRLLLDFDNLSQMSMLLGKCDVLASWGTTDEFPGMSSTPFQLAQALCAAGATDRGIAVSHSWIY